MAEFEKAVQDTITAGTEILQIGGGAFEGSTYILEQASQLASEQRDEFMVSAYFGIIKGALWNPAIRPDEPIKLIDYMPNEREWAKALTATAKDLVRDERFTGRGRELLSRSAKMFDRAYDQVQKYALLPPEELAPLLLEDYFGVIEAQLEADDVEGAQHTIFTIEPRLTDLADELDWSRDTDKTFRSKTRPALDEKLSLAVAHLGSLDTLTARKLFEKIESEQIKADTTRVLIKAFSSRLLEVGQSGEALEILAAQGLRADMLWHTAAALLKRRRIDTVQTFVEEVDQKMPGYYATCDEVTANETPMLAVLTEARRDDLLGEAFRSLLLYSAQNAVEPIGQFAYRCGLADDISRVQAMADSLALDKEQMKTVYDAFQAGVDAVS